MVKNRKGKNNPNYKGGKRNLICKNCRKRFKAYKRIYCSEKCQHKNIVPWNKGLKGIHLSSKTEFKKREASAFKNRKHSLQSITKNRIKNRGTHHSPKTEFKKGYKGNKKLNSNTIMKHHIYLNKIGRPNTKIILIKKYHDKIHNEAYDYLVQIGQIQKYIKQFYTKYKLGDIKYER